MREIGPSQPPYIIAEIGVNHDGSVERALQLVDAAADAQADAVKLQLFKADLLMSKAAKLAAYQKAAGESDPIEMLRRLELSIEQMRPIVERAHARGIHAIVTVFSLELVAEAERLAWDAYKTASPDIIHRPLLEALMATGRPLIVSTGAAELDEIKRAAGWLEAVHRRLAMLQCVSSYPTPLEGAELGGIGALAHALPATPIGYSDHTAEEVTGAMATRLGACILEKHSTYSCSAKGPDHAASLEPDGLARYCQLAHQTRTGAWPNELPRIKRVTERELDVRRVSRQSIVAKGDLPSGHVLTRTDLTFKRPGIGIEPFRLNDVIGKSLTRPIDADTPLTDADIR
ncbi:MAG: N-acetylneuraminate synthase family protein [Phycisphaerales bacterium]